MKKKITIQKLLAALVGIFMVSTGVAFNNAAGLGNDSVGIVYDGIRAAFGMNAEQLGMASNIVNIVLAVFLFIVARRYISAGTFVYLIPYGFFVSLGTKLYGLIFVTDAMVVRIVASVIGCLLLCIGVAIYIVIDIGVDPFTGVVLFLTDISKKEYKYVKIAFDCTLIVIGAILGGKFGVITFVTAVAVGPLIQFFKERITKWNWFNRRILSE